MSAWELPESADINGTTYAIRSDFRAVLDVMEILGDREISDEQRGALALEVFYVDFDEMPASDYKLACEWMMWFVQGGDSPAKPPKRKLADWKQDFPLIIAPVNRVLGFESREREHLHWWTFLGAYCEVGDCLFAQVVSIRKKKSKGKKLEKHEREFYNENRALVDLKAQETEEEKEIINEWIGGGNG